MEVNSWMETAKWQGLCIVPIIFVVALVAASTRLIASGGDLQLSDSPLDQDPLISSYEDNRNLGSRGLKIFNSSREKSATCSSSSSFDPAGCSQDLLPTRNESSLSSSLSTSLPSPPSPAGEQQGRDYHLELPTSSPTSNLNFKEREGGHEEGQQQEPHSLPSLAERIRSEEACYRAHCVRAAHNPENKAVAFALYGGAFRTGTTGGGVGYSCNRNGFEAQRAVYQSHVANVLSQFQKLDYSVDIFLIPYPCYNKNNQSYTESLHSWYAPVAFKVYSENMPTEKVILHSRLGLVRAKATNAVTSVDRRNGVIVEAINMIFAHENVTSSSYRFVLLMRLDTMIGSPITDFLETKFSRFDQNVFENGKPQVYHMENMQLIPRCMLSCVRRLFKERCIQVDYGSICGSTMNEVCHFREGNVYYPMVNFEEEQKAAGSNLEAGRFWLLTNQARGSNPRNASAKNFPGKLSDLVKKISKR